MNERAGMQFAPAEKSGVTLVSASNGVEVGEIFMMEDGYYQFWPKVMPGFWPAWCLHQIAEKVDSMNKEWDAKLREDLSTRCADNEERKET